MKKSIAWFASEIVVVVIGVLLALGINAWWQGVQNDEAEQNYLLQLRTDLTESLQGQRIDSVLSARYVNALSKLLRAYRQDSRPPDDSLGRWLFTGLNNSYSGVSIGTAEALVSSDALQLIRSDTLRSAIPEFLYDLRLRNSRMERLESQFVSGFRGVTALVDYPFLDQLTRTREEVTAMVANDPSYWLSPDSRQVSFGLSLDELLRDRHVYAELTYLYIIHLNIRGTRNEMLLRIRKLLNLLEHE